MITVKDITIGKNYYSKEVTITNARRIDCYFTDDNNNQINFSNKPDLNIMMMTTGVQNPIKISDIKQNGKYVGCVLGFGSITTATMKIEYKER